METEILNFILLIGLDLTHFLHVQRFRGTGAKYLNPLSPSTPKSQYLEFQLQHIHSSSKAPTLSSSSQVGCPEYDSVIRFYLST